APQRAPRSTRGTRSSRKTLRESASPAEGSTSPAASARWVTIRAGVKLKAPTPAEATSAAASRPPSTSKACRSVSRLNIAWGGAGAPLGGRLGQNVGHVLLPGGEHLRRRVLAMEPLAEREQQSLRLFRRLAGLERQDRHAGLLDLRADLVGSVVAVGEEQRRLE